MTTTTEAQRKRYARRVWADREIGAEMTPETLHTPLLVHGPETERDARRSYWRASLSPTCDPYVRPGAFEEA